MQRPTTDLRFPGLVDDASTFPPGNLPMHAAIQEHLRHREAWYAHMVGPFVCSDRRLPELQECLPAEVGEGGLAVAVTVQGGAGAVEPALRWLEKDSRLTLAGLEVALRDEDDLQHNAGRLTTVLGPMLSDVEIAYVEMPRLRATAAPAGWLEALDEVAAAGHRAKFRTGGTEPAAFPDAAELAALITAALDRELAFKCTAGLHNAVRHTDPQTGFDHHGFLNVLLATHVSLSGGTESDVIEQLQQRDADTLADAVASLEPAGVDSARRWFRSFGSCSVSEPVGDLVRLGLLAGQTGEQA